MAVNTDPHYFQTVSIIHYGWVCPKCGRVYSPTTVKCLYCGGDELTLEIKGNGEWSEIDADFVTGYITKEKKSKSKTAKK